MKISELVEKLMDIQSSHGDLSVECKSPSPLVPFSSIISEVVVSPDNTVQVYGYIYKSS